MSSSPDDASALEVSDRPIDSMSVEELREEIQQIELDSLRVASGESDLRRRFPDAARRLDRLVAQLQAREAHPMALPPERDTRQLSDEETYDLRRQLLDDRPEPEPAAPSPDEPLLVGEPVEAPRDYDLDLADDADFEVEADVDAGDEAHVFEDSRDPAGGSDSHLRRTTADALRRLVERVNDLQAAIGIEPDESADELQAAVRAFAGEERPDQLATHLGAVVDAVAARLSTAMGAPAPGAAAIDDGELRAELEEARAMADEQRNAADAALAELDAARHQRTAALEQAAEAREQLSELGRRLEEAGTEREALEQRALEAEERATAAEEIATTAERRAGELEAERDELAEQKADADRQRDEAEEARGALEEAKKALEEEKSALESARAEVEGARDAALERVEELEARTGELEARAAELDGSLTEGRERIESLQAELAEASERIESLEGELAAARERAETTGAELEQERERAGTLESELAAARAGIEERDGALADRERERDDARELASKLEERSTVLEAKVARAREALAALTDDD